MSQPVVDASKIEQVNEQQVEQQQQPIQATTASFSPPAPQQEPEPQPQAQNIDATIQGLYIQIIALQHNQIQQLKQGQA